MPRPSPPTCQARPAPRRGCCHEPFGWLHPPSGRDLAADGRRRGAGHCRVPEPAGGGASERGLPDHPGLGAVAGRGRQDDGIVGRDAVGTAVRPDFRRHPDDERQRQRLHADHDAIRQVPHGGLRCRRRAGSDQRGRRAVAGKRGRNLPRPNARTPARTCASRSRAWRWNSRSCSRTRSRVARA